MSESEWAQAICSKIGAGGERDVERVRSLLLEHGINPGRARDRHKLCVLAVQFTGLKHVPLEPPDEQHPGTPDTETVPFSFTHVFLDGFTAFATDHINDAGKSTVLGVILWAIHGSPPSPTLQADVRAKWLREATVVFEIDGVVHVTSWVVNDGVPRGGIYTLASVEDLDLPALDAAGLTAWLETGDAGAPVADSDGPSAAQPPDSAADAPVKIPEDTTGRGGPATDAILRLVEERRATVVATFDTADEFESAVGSVMLDRLDLEPVLVYARNPGALDASDGSVVQHGWSALSQAVSIIDPTAATVLGEHPMLIQHLMGVFLGSRWAHPTATAHRNLQRIDGQLAAVRRRREGDRTYNEATVNEMKDVLAELNVKLGEFGDAPPFDRVMEAASQAKSDAVAAAQAYSRMLNAASEFGEAARAHATAERDLHALTEAMATKRFFHSLRPSCCPRCDAQIDTDKWAREKSGHCSLCDSAFLNAPAGDIAAASDATSGEATHSDDEEDQLTALLEQVAQLSARADELSEAHDVARDEYAALDGIAEDSAAQLSAFDQATSLERYTLEKQITRLEGRIAEREEISREDDGDEIDKELQFARAVFAAAKDLATLKRNEEQRETVALVSETLTRLGSEFGIRNLESATLQANGHLPVVKGGQKEKFSGLNPGERLRLKIALIVGLLEAGVATGRGRHPGLLIVDDLTTHEINPDDAAKIAASLSTIDGLQFITASTLGPRLAAVVGPEHVVMPNEGQVVLF